MTKSVGGLENTIFIDKEKDKYAKKEYTCLFELEEEPNTTY